MSNAVEALLIRNGLQDLVDTFKSEGISKISALRNMPSEKMAELVPNEDHRKTLMNSLDRSSASAAPVGPASIGGSYLDTAAAGGRGRGSGKREDGDRPRKTRACRPFYSEEGCKYGDDCKYSHDPELSGDIAKSQASISQNQYEEAVVVPWDSVKLLLGKKAEKLNKINQMCGTTNSRIERPDDYATTFSFKLRGSPEGVARAKAEVERFVGITGQQTKEARFQYANEELKHNQTSVRTAVHANLRNADTPFALSENVVKRLVQTFRFEHPPQLSHMWALSNNADRDKFEVLTKAVQKLKGAQAIVFTDHTRVIEMAKRASQTTTAFGVPTAQFVHRNLTKEDRMAALEAFKRGEANENGVKQRVLVTSNDYAKLARKILIPYVNLIVHFQVPKTKELYLHQAMCAGRKGFKGISFMCITPYDSQTPREWGQSIPLEEYKDDLFAKHAEGLVYDTTTTNLTDALADPDPNWRENLEKEKVEKARLKAEKAAAKEAAASAAAAEN